MMGDFLEGLLGTFCGLSGIGVGFIGIANVSRFYGLCMGYLEQYRSFLKVSHLG